VARLTRATRLIAAGRLDERLVADTADELGRLVEDFNSMTDTLVAQRAELARANQLKAWAEMSRQVAHEVKNPLTPIQLAAEHLQRVHDDQGRPLGSVVDLCLNTILKQVKLLRRIASEFSTFATQPTQRLEPVRIAELLESVVEPYRPGLPENVRLQLDLASNLPLVRCDRTQMARALTNLSRTRSRPCPTEAASVWPPTPTARPSSSPSRTRARAWMRKERDARSSRTSRPRPAVRPRPRECEAHRRRFGRSDCPVDGARPGHHRDDYAAVRPSRRARIRVTVSSTKPETRYA
jgi:hypothetical protein